MEYTIDITKVFREKKDTWDKVVPIVQRGREYHCYISDQIEEANNYNELCYLIESVDEYDTIVLHINTPGGHLDSAFMILASIYKSKTKVKAVLTGTVASAGTIITMACDELEVAPYTQFMIHNYSTGTQGKGHEVLDYINFTDKNLKTTFKELYGGFLTEEEIDEVIKGKDMWLDSDDVIQRWANKKA